MSEGSERGVVLRSSLAVCSLWSSSGLILPTIFKMNTLVQMLCLLTRFACSSDGEPTRFDQERSVHVLAPVSTNHINYLASLSNDTEFYHDLHHILKPRIPGTTGHKEVGKFIVNKMRRLGWQVEEDKFIAHTPHDNTVHMKNIIATLDPIAPRRIAIACHYDSKIMREVFYGATDSAAPCAMMLNLAQTMQSVLQRHKNLKHRYTLQLIFFDGEEAFVEWSAKDSLYGSRHLAKKWAKERYVENPHHDNDKTTQLHRMDLLVLLDLLGAEDPNIPSYFSDTKHLHKALIESERMLDRLAHLKNHKKNYFTSAHTWSKIEDDHIPFLRKGVPVLHVIPNPFPSVWHTYKDNADALDEATMHNLNKILRVFVSQYLGLEKL